MESHPGRVTILMADDDAEDRLLTVEAMQEARVLNEFRFVSDGEELMDYLHRRGKYTGREESPRPQLILLDLNMPRKDGREALWEIKSDPELRRIPVVVLTTSTVDEDVLRSYDVGASAFMVKPVTFERLVEAMRALGRYWVEFVELPREEVYEPAQTRG